MKFAPEQMVKVIEHSLLHPEAGEDRIAVLCHEAIEYGFRSVCVHPCHVGFARGLLKGTGVKLTTVIAFPLGMTLTKVKVFEAQEAAALGAEELDVVMNIALAKQGRWDALEGELREIVAATPGVAHKVIIEACCLTNDEKRHASQCALHCGASYVKTSTGFGKGGATLEDVSIIREAVGEACGIKAAGGIRTLRDAEALLHEGANILGTSSGISILDEMKRRDLA